MFVVPVAVAGGLLQVEQAPVHVGFPGVEDMPVYGTMASQFNDPGTNGLYRALMRTIYDKTQADLVSTIEIPAAKPETRVKLRTTKSSSSGSEAPNSNPASVIVAGASSSLNDSLSGPSTSGMLFGPSVISIVTVPVSVSAPSGLPSVMT